MWQLVSRILGAAVVAVGVGASASVFAMGLDPAFEGPAIGPAKAKGVIVWSHGRSINAEDSESSALIERPWLQTITPFALAGPNAGPSNAGSSPIAKAGA